MWERFGGFPANGYVELLQDLCAQDAGSLFPEVNQQPARLVVFLACCSVVRVDKNVRVDERSTANALPFM
jgi:hypothetical protein